MSLPGWVVVEGKAPLPKSAVVVDVTGTLLVGRDPASCRLVFSDSSVSRKHAEFNLSTNAAELSVRDLKSTFGTLVNGTKLASSSQVLHSGDCVQFGASGKSHYTVLQRLKVCTSGLTNRENDMVRDVCGRLLAVEFVDAVEDEGGGARGVVVLPNKNWRVTSKVLTGLLLKQEFVTLEWIVQLGKQSSEGEGFAPPATARYQPGPLSSQQAENLMMMASQQQHGAAPSQASCAAPASSALSVNFSPQAARNELFKGQDFVTMEGEEEGGQQLGVEVDMLRRGGGRVVGRFTGSSASDAILVCGPSVDAFRAQFAHLAHVPAVDKPLIIHSVLTLAPLQPVSGVVKQRSPSPPATPVAVALVPASSKRTAMKTVVVPPTTAPTTAPTSTSTITTKAVVRPSPPPPPDYNNSSSLRRSTTPVKPPVEVMMAHADDDEEEEEAAFSRARVVPMADHRFTAAAAAAPAQKKKKEASPAPPPESPPVAQDEPAPPPPPPQQQPKITVFPDLSADWEWTTTTTTTVTSTKKPSSTVKIEREVLVKAPPPPPPAAPSSPSDTSSTLQLPNFKKFRKNAYIPGAHLAEQRRGAAAVREVEVAVEATVDAKLQEERERNELKAQELIMLNAFGGGVGASKRRPVAAAVKAKAPATTKRAPAASRKKPRVSSSEEEEEEEEALDSISEPDTD